MTNSIKVRLKPEQGIKVGLKTTYIYDNSLIEDEVELAKDWARKTNGQVVEDGEPVDYSSKAWAIGGTGTETNNSKYYAEQSGSSASDASDSATLASDKATEAEGHATDAQTWAEGTDAQVELLDGEHSSKGWALASREYMFGGAIYDGDNERIEMSPAYQDLAEVAKTNSYNDLDDLPTIGSGTLTIQKNSATINTFSANSTSDTTINITVPTSAADVGALPSSTTIADLTSTAQLNALNSGITSTDVSQITTNKNNIDSIDGMIPSQASSSNKLADKNFVNSSIATNTANFIGTFNSVAELEAYSGTLTNNDYAFVVGTDSDGNTIYDRYKYTTATTPASWVYEYTLNNSSFTAAQWAAINSGATSALIGEISGKLDDATVNGTSIVTDGVAEIPIAAQNVYGVVKLGSTTSGLQIASATGNIGIVAATENNLNEKTNAYRPVVSTNLDYAVKRGVAYNSLTLTDAEKASACSWLGAQGAGNYVTTDTAQDITATKTFKAPQKIQSGATAGSLVLGADLNSTTVTAGTRKVARIGMPTNEGTGNLMIICGETLGDSSSTIGQTGSSTIYNRVEFGSRPGNTSAYAPDGIGFTVAKVHNSLLVADKIYALEMSKEQARFNVPPNYSGRNLELVANTESITSGTSFECADNTIYDGGSSAIANVTCTLPATIPADYSVQINFTSGTTATTFTYDNSIKWVEGCDDIQVVSGVRKFVPVASKRYTVVFISNGVEIIANAKGV